MATAVSYAIFLTDQARVLTLQTQFPNGTQVPPNVAASVYGLPLPGSGTISQAGYIGVFPQDSVGFAPNLASSYGSETFNLTYTDSNTTIACFWVGYFLYQGASGTVSPPAANPRYLGARSWCDGFESPQQGSGETGNMGKRYTRDASRTPDGLGLAYRGAVTLAQIHSLVGLAKKVSWERFYLRLRKLPVGGDDNIWYVNGSGEAGASLLLNVNTSGTLQGYFKGNVAYPGQSAGTSAALTLNVWYKIDIRLEFLTTSSPSAKMDVYINGALSFSGTGTNNANSQNHNTSQLGQDNSSTTHALECDYDDWIRADEVSVTNPTTGIVTKYPGNDLTSGSHVVLVRPTGFGTGHSTASWLGIGAGGPTGNWEEVNNLADTAGATAGLSTTIVGANLTLNTDYLKQQSGLASMAVGFFPFASGGNVGTNVQWGISGQTRKTTTPNAGSWSSTGSIYSIVSGATADTLPDIGSVILSLTTGTGAGGNMTVTGFFASAEFIGAWGAEDASASSVWAYPIVRPGPHNSAYPTIQANNAALPPIHGVRVAQGTYTGNAIGQDVLSNIAPHWWYVRQVGSTVGGFWYSSMVNPHTFVVEALKPEVMNQSKIAGTQSIAGSNSAANSSGNTFQYVAVSDLAMRFIINGAFAHKSTVASAVNNLPDTGFTPDACFFFIEDYTSGSSGHYFKGVGHTTDSASVLDGASATGIASLAAGSITSKTTLSTDAPNTAYSAWRKSDGSGAAQWMDVVQYTGNASGADRDIAVSLNGQTPIFAIVTPHNAGSFVRDPSHLTTHSLQIGTGDSTTGIVGFGVNKITVNNACNAGAVVYDVFVLCAAGAVPAVRPPGIWPTAPAYVAISPTTLTVTQQWRVHRFDIKPRAEEHL